ncbi:MAG: DUF3536 domain-containing protein [Deltaproteobacteria bacterium]|nr:DUF3536 domain-containing protein [Deltaproteobacteria bacterium]
MKKNSNRFLCVHGHFNQPPRDNPWTGMIHMQKSAEPYHDWNERITRECYGPNTRSRIHDENGHIKRLVNNYEHISFNFGTTLLSWLYKSSPWIYSQIIEAEKKRCKLFGGHGNAMAQVYNHIIMPLAQEQDKITQIRWGLADFLHRFGRKAEGMWLAETAVNSETLKAMAIEGVKFTILSPFQAHMTRDITPGKSAEWLDVSNGVVDCTRPYRCFLSEDRSLYIDIFFYNGSLSRAIAYEKLLGSGEAFLAKIKEAYPQEADVPLLVSMATDGESYGHHFKFGEMALAWVLDTVKHREDIIITNYGEFLEISPPAKEVMIFENSSWSCAHGVERWRSNCGCSVSQDTSRTQTWRTPLRDGLDWLNRRISSIFERETRGLLKERWDARNDYISILLKGDENKKEDFLKRHSARPLNKKEEKLIFRLLESQKYALYMFTSCGWFFDDISGLEAVQILMYAKKSIELCDPFSTENLEKGLMDYLEKAMSNNKNYKSGLEVYKKKVIPSNYKMISLFANYAILSVIDRNNSLEWLRNIIDPQNIKTGIAIENRIFYAEADDPEALGQERKICGIAVQYADNGLKCISGRAGINNLEPVREIANEILSGRVTDLNSISTCLSDTALFTYKEMMPDVKSEIAGTLSEKLEQRLLKTVWERPEEVYNSIRYSISAGKALSDNLHYIIQSISSYLFLKLFKYSNDTPINYNDIEYLLSLFEREPDDEEAPADKTVFDPVTLFHQERIARSVERFLLEQVSAIRHNTINLNLNNIRYALEFIQKYNIHTDLWQFQNLFYDLKNNKDLMNKIHQDFLMIFQQIQRLLGFSGGNQYA